MQTIYLSIILLSIRFVTVSGGETTPIPLADFGVEVNGLRTHVSLTTATVSVGKPVEIRFIKRNVSKADLIVWHSGFWPNHQIIVKDADRKEAALTAMGTQRHKAFHPGGNRDKNYPLTLAPGKEDDTERGYDLAQHFDLTKPGKYTVEIVYEEKQAGWEGRVVSNAAAFEIVK